MHLDDGPRSTCCRTALFRLLAGRVAIVATSAQAGRLQVDTPAGRSASTSRRRVPRGAVRRRGPCHARWSSRSSAARAELASDRERLSVEAGQRAWARGGEAPSHPVCVQLGASATRSIDWAHDRAAIPARTDVRAVRARDAAAVRGDTRHVRLAGTTSRHTATSGTRAWPPAGARTTAGGGGSTADFGLDVDGRRSRGPGPRTTTAAGASSAAGRGSGFPDATGARRGCTGRSRPGYVSWCPLGYDNYPVRLVGTAAATTATAGTATTQATGIRGAAWTVVAAITSAATAA